MSLIDTLRKSRQSMVMVHGHQYTIRRPTDAEAITLGGETGLTLVHRFVVGWDHSALSMGIPGGDAEPIPFDVELWREWVADQPQLWGQLAGDIVSAYTRYRESREDAEKNS